MGDTKSDLKSWERQHFQSGGGDPFLFYVIYGCVDTAAPLSRSKYRCNGMPDGLDVMAYGPESSPEVPASFRDGFLWEQLKETNGDLAEAIGSQDSCVVVRGTFSDPENLDYLRDTVGLITHFLDNGGVGVFDPQMFEWWSPEKWRERIFDPNGAVPRNHSRIFLSEDKGGTNWLHTRGLRKFGRPDLSIPEVPDSHMDDHIELCNRLIELQAFGGIVAEGQEIRMESLPAGLKCHHDGSLEDPDFNNIHIRISKPIADY